MTSMRGGGSRAAGWPALRGHALWRLLAAPAPLCCALRVPPAAAPQCGAAVPPHPILAMRPRQCSAQLLASLAACPPAGSAHFSSVCGALGRLRQLAVVRLRHLAPQLRQHGFHRVLPVPAAQHEEHARVHHPIWRHTAHLDARLEAHLRRLQPGNAHSGRRQAGKHAIHVKARRAGRQGSEGPRRGAAAGAARVHAQLLHKLAAARGESDACATSMDPAITLPGPPDAAPRRPCPIHHHPRAPFWCCTAKALHWNAGSVRCCTISCLPDQDIAHRSKFSRCKCGHHAQSADAGQSAPAHSICMEQVGNR